VELLVVVVIISMLAALLLPAVTGARERARIAQCMNNQRQLGLAIQQYDSAKQHLPGYVNRVNNVASPNSPYCIGWVPVLLPFLGRRDLWEGSPGVNGWRTGNPATEVCVLMNDLVCPDDKGVATATYPLSYVVNLGSYNTVPTAGVVTPVSTPGLFRDYFTGVTSSGPTNTITLSSVKSPSRTVMLSELASTTRDWTTTGIAIVGTPAASPIGFSWPDPSLSDSGQTLYQTCIGVPTGTLFPPLPKIHPQIVNVTFCDGHSESLPDDTLCKNDPTNTIFGMP